MGAAGRCGDGEGSTRAFMSPAGVEMPRGSRRNLNQKETSRALREKSWRAFHCEEPWEIVFAIALPLA
jgi:hypothetical protein